jgi:alkanesulfonate monooxygenase SsuD/methylene tetrahydromethanopterin reductase-like flavin-dependent oxidoreductase (luciferase family)
MRYGISLPNFDDFSDPRLLAKLAREAEQAGWDAFFLWDHMLGSDLPRPFADPWVALSAVAMHTERIRLGPLLTPLPRRRPWKVAREALTLDHLSQGRVILGAGLGDPARWEYGSFGEDYDLKVRAEKLDEGLEILTGLWSGEPFGYQGQHYQIETMTFLPKPVQSPRIPIWLGGFWPNKPPFRRAARYDGICAHGKDGLLSPDDWRDILAYITKHRTAETPFDAAYINVTPGDNPQKSAAIVAPYAAAGLTWWIEDISPFAFGRYWDAPWSETMTETLRNRIHQGPPRIE